MGGFLFDFSNESTHIFYYRPLNYHIDPVVMHHVRHKSLNSEQDLLCTHDDRLCNEH